MALVTTIPISISNPSMAGQAEFRPVRARAGKALIIARGSVRRITMG